LAEVILNNKSRQKDSDGFMLGARVEQIQQIDILLRSNRREQFNTPEQIATAYNSCRSYVADIRKLQKQLGIDDDAMISAMGVTKPEGFSQFKTLLASYEAAR